MKYSIKKHFHIFEHIKFKIKSTIKFNIKFKIKFNISAAWSHLYLGGYD